MQPLILSHSLFFQNRNCGKDILAIIIIPLWFKACIYWKFFSWRHHFQPYIFSVIASLFHGSAWRNPNCVFFTTLFAAIHYQPLPSVVDLRKSWSVCLFQENHCDLVLLKVPIYSTELVAIIFFEKYCVKCTKALTEIPFFHGEPT